MDVPMNSDQSKAGSSRLVLPAVTDLLYNHGWVGKQSRIELSVQDGAINVS